MGSEWVHRESCSVGKDLNRVEHESLRHPLTPFTYFSRIKTDVFTATKHKNSLTLFWYHVSKFPWGGPMLGYVLVCTSSYSTYGRYNAVAMPFLPPGFATSATKGYL